MVDFGKFFILWCLWSFGSGICGRIWFYQDEKNGEGRRYGYRKICIADGGADDGIESNGGWIGLVGFGYGGLLYRAAFPYEAQRVMRMKDIYKLTWDDCRRGLRRGQK